MSTVEPSEPRSLADALRTCPDQQLAQLLANRPDLLTPVPSDVTALTARATTRASVQRALEHLDRFTLQVVEVLAILPEPCSVSAVAALVRTDPPSDSLPMVTAAVSELRDRALVWGADHSLRLVRTVRDWVGPSPAGTGPPVANALGQLPISRVREIAADLSLPSTPDKVSALEGISALFTDRVRLERLLGEAADPSRQVLDRLAWGPPTGRVEEAFRPVRVAAARTPVEWLLARGLLAPVSEDTVVLPREVALHLRGGRLHRATPTPPPLVTTGQRDPGLSDRTAAGAAFTAVAKVEEVLRDWGTGGAPPVLRSGGLGVRDLRRTASGLEVEEWAAATLLEVAHSAGLLAESDDSEDGDSGVPLWLPTPAYDTWCGWPVERRWVALVEAWLESVRLPGLVGERLENDRLVAALGPELDRPLAPELRTATLRALATLEPGQLPTVESVLEVLEWQRPLRGALLRERAVRWTLREAQLLGVAGLGGLAGYARPLLNDEPVETDKASLEPASLEAVTRELAPLLPEPVDHVLLQADLTAVAPGPLVPELARTLELVADVESTGGATVYRFSEGSVRRALDAGRTLDDLRYLLAHHSRTPVPQPLTYLVEDVARRHGRVRVGTANAYLRCDDPGVLDELVTDRRCARLRLRRLAPTVVVSQSPVDVVLELLREAGYAPAAESASGDLMVTRQDTRRAPGGRRPSRVVTEPSRPAADLLAAAVRMIRTGDRVSTAPVVAAGELAGVPRAAAEVDCTDTESLLATLELAATGNRAVRLSYLDYQGRVNERIVYPNWVARGCLRAYDEAAGRVHSFPLHRIRHLAVLEDPR